MEEIDEKEINFESLKNLEVEEIFPKSIIYPGQTDLIKDPNLSTSALKIDFHPVWTLEPYLIKFPFHPEERIPILDMIIDNDTIYCCGGSYIHSFNLSDLKKDIFEPSSKYYAENEVFHSIAMTQFLPPGDKTIQLLACGGLSSVIRIINLNERNELRQLIGHRNEIYDLKFHPNEPDLLLSASKDFSIRLWNILTGTQICIFGGPEGHSADVLSIDWHLSADYFVSTGIDEYIKIWKIEEVIKEKILESRNVDNPLTTNLEKKPFKTLIKSNTMFSCNTLHSTHVDCVRFNGNFIISKSVDGKIKEWLPIFNSEGDFYYLVNTYQTGQSTKIWYIKFSLDSYMRLLAVGNNRGNVFIYELNCTDNLEDENSNFYNHVKPKCTIASQSNIVRQTAFHREMKFMAWANEEGFIFINEFIHK